MTAQRKAKQTRKASLEQADSSTMAAPVEPPDPTEAPPSIDVEREERELAALMAAVKAKKAKLASHKKQALGGAKLEKKRVWVPEAMSWVLKRRLIDSKGNTEKRGGLASQLVLAVQRANDAVASLATYEEKIGLPADERTSDRYADMMAAANEAAEALSAMSLDTTDPKKVLSLVSLD